MPTSQDQPGTIVLDTAQTRINWWRQDQQVMQTSIRVTHPELSNRPLLTTKSFAFKLEDLQYLLHRIDYWNTNCNPSYAGGPRTAINTNPINAIRLYPGNKAQTTIGSTAVGCLMGVGVTRFRPEDNSGGNDLVYLNGGASGIYDISQPCPNLCPQFGIMNSQTEIAVEEPFTISLSDAKTRISNWTADQTAVKAVTTINNSPVVNINSAAFALSDLQSLLAEIDLYNGLQPIVSPTPSIANPVNGVRFYFGKKTHEGMPVAPYACLIAVGVTGFSPASNLGGNDVVALPALPTPTHPYNGLVSSIYDFSYPCPTTCDNYGAGLMSQ
jgi:hypothetical protein